LSCGDDLSDVAQQLVEPGSRDGPDASAEVSPDVQERRELYRDISSALRAQSSSEAAVRQAQARCGALGRELARLEERIRRAGFGVGPAQIESALRGLLASEGRGHGTATTGHGSPREALGNEAALASRLREELLAREREMRREVSARDEAAQLALAEARRLLEAGARPRACPAWACHTISCSARRLQRCRRRPWRLS